MHMHVHRVIYSFINLCLILQQITVSTPSWSEPYSRVVEHSLCKLGQALAGGHLPTIAKLVLAHEGIREHILLKLFDLIDAEMQTAGAIVQLHNAAEGIHPKVG